MNTITTIITMVKAGHGSVTLKQGQYSDGQKWYVMTANGIDTSINGPIAMNMAYKQYIANGWTVKPAKEEKKVAAPKPPKKVKKSREEALTEKYGDKDQRRAYIQRKNAIILQVKEEVREWTKTHRRLTKDEWKKVVNDEVAKRLAALN